jgi:predicted DNA-binding protein with PD1-like motif
VPYIKQQDRDDLDDKISYAGRHIQNPGELNYMITRFLNQYLLDAVINEIIGALECAKLELYRRVAAPYEDLKIKENGDVYTV